MGLPHLVLRALETTRAIADGVDMHFSRRHWLSLPFCMHDAKCSTWSSSRQIRASHCRTIPPARICWSALCDTAFVLIQYSSHFSNAWVTACIVQTQEPHQIPGAFMVANYAWMGNCSVYVYVCMYDGSCPRPADGLPSAHFECDTPRADSAPSMYFVGAVRHDRRTSP